MSVCLLQSQVISMQCAPTKLSSVPCPALQHFSTQPKKSHALTKENKMFFLFSLQHLSEIVLIIKGTEREMIRNVYWSTCKVPFFFCQIFMKPKFSRQVYEKYSNIKFHEKPYSGSLLFPFGRKDGQTYITKLVVASQFCEFSYRG